MWYSVKIIRIVQQILIENHGPPEQAQYDAGHGGQARHVGPPIPAQEEPCVQGSGSDVVPAT